MQVSTWRALPLPSAHITMTGRVPPHPSLSHPPKMSPLFDVLSSHFKCPVLSSHGSRAPPTWLLYPATIHTPQKTGKLNGAWFDNSLSWRLSLGHSRPLQSFFPCCILELALCSPHVSARCFRWWLSSLTTLRKHHSSPILPSRWATPTLGGNGRGGRASTVPPSPFLANQDGYDCEDSRLTATTSRWLGRRGLSLPLGMPSHLQAL